MKKVLILAYDFPPYISVGAQRPYYWYRYFREFGIDPVVVSRQWNNNFTGANQYVAEGYSDEDVIKETEYGLLLKAPYKPNAANKLYLKYGDKKYRLIRKIISGFYEIMQWHFPIGPKIGIYKTAKEYLSKNKVDIIIASGDPFILFKYASKLSNKYKTPWIADYRDPWIERPASKSFALTFIKLLNKWNEKNYLRSASVITTVSEYFVNLIRNNLPNKCFQIIPNGFNLEAATQASIIQQNSKEFTITYIGRIYPYYPIESFLICLHNFIIQSSDLKIKLRLIGISGNRDFLTQQTLFNNAFVNIEVLPALSGEELMKELAKSNILLLFNSYSTIGTKIYDYIAIKRKILLCFSEEPAAMDLKEKYFTSDFDNSTDQNAQANLILEKDAGIIVKNKEHFLEVLNDLYKEFSETGQIECHSKDISEYSRKAQTEKLAELIKSIVKKTE